MRALDFQGCEKNRLASPLVKPPPAGLLDTAREPIPVRAHASRTCGRWRQGRGTAMYYNTQNVDFSSCPPRDPTAGDPPPAQSTTSD